MRRWLLLAVCAVGCSDATPIPIRPVPAPHVPVIVVSGQSNSGLLAQIMTLYAPTRWAGLGGAPIALWSAIQHPRYENDWGWVWPDLAQQLTYAPAPDALVWIHGESDATDELIPQYEAAATELFARVRQITRPDFPIVIVGMGSYKFDVPRWEAMRVIQRRLAETIPHTAYVSSEGLDNNLGGQHLTEDGQRLLAPKVFAAVQALRGR